MPMCWTASGEGRQFGLQSQKATAEQYQFLLQLLVRAAQARSRTLQSATAV